MTRAILALSELAGMAVGAVELTEYEIGHGRVQRTMALMSALAAIVSGFEAYIQHMRGAFRDWRMWTPVVLTPPTALVAGSALVSRRTARVLLPWTSLAMLADGVVGFGLHLRGVHRMPGGYKMGNYNVTMGPPLFAPLLLTTVGVLGLLAAFLRPEELRRRRHR